MRPVYSGAEVRAAEQPLLDAGLGPELMRRAAHGLAQHVAAVLQGPTTVAPQGGFAVSGGRRRASKVYGARVAAYVGPGNNGGDALFALAELRRRGVDCLAFTTHARWHDDAMLAFRAAGGRVVDARDRSAAAELLSSLDVLIDGVTGTGTRVGDEPRPIGLPAPPPGVHVVACDLPSGVDADTGRAEPGTLAADTTVCFGALKRGLAVGEGSRLGGETTVVDIGLGPHLPEPSAWLCNDPAPPGPPAWNAHKYSRGVVGLVAGSEQYPGAAVLAARAAVNAGIGMLVAVVPESAPTVRRMILSACPEAVVTAPGGAAIDRVSAWVLGPGIGDDDEQRLGVERALASGQPAVVDASALPYLGSAGRSPATVLTPHAGELASLLSASESAVGASDVLADPIHWARRAAETLGSVVALKGPATAVATPDGQVRLVTRGPSALATAGTGDVLAGVTGALLSGGGRGIGLPEAAELTVQAVNLHASAALRLPAHGFGASALAEAIGAERSVSSS
ncbi:NAD(P)H-hydrate dehydratase [Zhihengliuella salsuginis]|uniref:ADP-dependent (S)-NAD(P)H-hydrate dehydratase n=1 Tax=Zhihengliuella salsuginis TaxID=578222 RepID=A0ABQ3GFY3_9MICC|nr:NAD(P)H-hydrate dehydratase [Zhihengliuella salsuginis]GHD04395.1 bifunctional NAD(P)H-hydrate repair enzyme [Zhihengliuella salsuginis]